MKKETSIPEMSLSVLIRDTWSICRWHFTFTQRLLGPKYNIPLPLIHYFIHQWLISFFDHPFPQRYFGNSSKTWNYKFLHVLYELISIIDIPSPGQIKVKQAKKIFWASTKSVHFQNDLYCNVFLGIIIIIHRENIQYMCSYLH